MVVLNIPVQFCTIMFKSGRDASIPHLAEKVEKKAVRTPGILEGTLYRSCKHCSILTWSSTLRRAGVMHSINRVSPRIQKFSLLGIQSRIDSFAFTLQRDVSFYS